MITTETAIAAIVTFLAGVLFGLMVGKIGLRYALKTKEGKRILHRLLEEAEKDLEIGVER